MTKAYGTERSTEGRGGAEARSYWLERMRRVAEPVLAAAAARRLKAAMPVEAKTPDRGEYTHLEAVGRTLVGIAPWLEGDGGDAAERELRERFGAMARQAIDAITDPASPDRCRFTSDRPHTQSLVDAAFLAHALLRAPTALWAKLDPTAQRRLADDLISTRRIRPPFNNWLLFAATIEAALHRIGEQADPMRIDYAIRQHEQWYKGDGVYGDGPSFAWDYYNSYVIQPMLLDVVRAAGPAYVYDFAGLEPKLLARARRYAAVQERLISPEGTFPAIGRSLAYRTGAFQHLAAMALRDELPAELSPAQVRCALQAVIRRCLEPDANYDADGWLRIGLVAAQPSLGEGYISTGSLYLCSTVFLPLGLPPTHPFWSAPDEPWTSRRVWDGGDLPADHALHD